MKTNYHTHTYLCKHALGEVKDYIKVAVDNNFYEIGMTDHAPIDEKYNVILSQFRMRCSDEKRYFEMIDQAKVKYSKDISIKTGFEVECYLPFIDSYYEHIKKKVDFLVLGTHFIHHNEEFITMAQLNCDEHLETYACDTIKVLNTNNFKFYAHPDLFSVNFPIWNTKCTEISNRILKTCESLKIPIEFNANGIRKGKYDGYDEWGYRYPRKQFFELSKNYNVEIIVNSDAHATSSLNDIHMDKAFELLDSLNIKPINKLNFTK